MWRLMDFSPLLYVALMCGLASLLKLFFDLYHGLPDTSLSSLALSCLVQIASVRRSLFNNTERAKFLNGLVAGVKDILLNPRKLTDPSNYHEFCRLLARLKSNYQLGELVKVRIDLENSFWGLY